MSLSDLGPGRSSSDETLPPQIHLPEVHAADAETEFSIGEVSPHKKTNMPIKMNFNLIDLVRNSFKMPETGDAYLRWQMREHLIECFSGAH